MRQRVAELREPAQKYFFLFIVLLLVFSLVLQWLGKNTLDHDELEAVRWGLASSWVVDKHPPLTGWIGHFWAMATGYSTFFFLLFSKLNAFVALIMIYLLNREFLSPKLALLSVAVFATSYPFIIMSQQLDANSVVIAIWPLTALLAWRALNQDNVFLWCILGLTAAMATLGKYHTVLFCIALFGAFCSHSKARLPKQWILLGLAVLCFIAILSPHLYGLWKFDFPTFSYASNRIFQDTESQVSGRLSALVWLPAQILFNLFSVVLLIGLLWRKKAFAVRANKEQNAQSFLIWVGLVFPILPIAVSVIMDIQLATYWGFNAWFLTPTLALYLIPAEKVSHIQSISLKWFCWFFPFYLMLSTALIIANQFSDVARPSAIPAASHLIDKKWRESTNDPLTLVISPSRQGQGLAFYSDFHPNVANGTQAKNFPWLLDAALCHSGGVAFLALPEQTQWLATKERDHGAPSFQYTVTADENSGQFTKVKPLTFSVLAYPGGLCF